MLVNFFQDVLVIRTTNYSDLGAVWEWEDDTCSVPLLQEITPTQGICMIIQKHYFQGIIYYRNIRKL